jgi:hypothetical protein
MLAVTLATLMAGCAGPAGRYCARRWTDFGDCVEATVGYGFPVHARVKATDFAVAGAGVALARRAGWKGRYGTYGGGGVPPTAGIGFHPGTILQGGIPLLTNGEMEASLVSKSQWSVETLGPCVTRHTYMPGLEPGPRSLVAERFWVGGTVALLLSARLEINPVEFVDLLAGIVGWDMLQDDEWVGTPERRKP